MGDFARAPNPGKKDYHKINYNLSQTMGWGKKHAEADGEESKRSRLFGGKKEKPASPAPSASNPYAAAPPPNGNPYASKSSNPYAGANGKSDPSAAPSQSSFGQPPSTSYSNSTKSAPPWAMRSPV